MARPKNIPKTGGRKKGTPNKATVATRQLLSSLFEDKAEKIKESLEKLESKPEKYLSAWAKLLPYFAPRLQSVELREYTTLEQYALMSDEERLEKIAEIRKREGYEGK